MRWFWRDATNGFFTGDSSARTLRRYSRFVRPPDRAVCSGFRTRTLEAVDLWCVVSLPHSVSNHCFPHLTGISNNVGTAENYTFHYNANQSLNSPFSPPTNFGTNWTFLSSVVNGIPLTTSFTYDSAGSGELDQ